MTTLNTYEVNGSYDSYLKNFILGKESNVDHVYADTKGIPTVGIGYALIIQTQDADGNKIFVIRNDIDKHLRAIGVLSDGETFRSEFADDYEILRDIIRTLNDSSLTAMQRISGATELVGWDAVDPDLAPFSNFEFTLGANQAQQLYDVIIKEYESHIWIKLKSACAEAGVYYDDEAWKLNLEGTEELATLTSLSYNSPDIIAESNKFFAALVQGDRAAAWFEIAYRTNGDKSSGIASRRFKEADAFRPHTTEEWDQFNQLCIDRQGEIAAYHVRYGAPSNEYVINWSFPVDDHYDLAFIHQHNEAGNIIPLWTDAKTSQATWKMLQSVNPQGATVVAMSDGSLYTVTRQGVLVTDAEGHSTFHYIGSNGKWQDVELNDDGTLKPHYIVKKGDSLGAIAKALGISQQELQDLNGITDPNKLSVGQKLLLPEGTPFESEAQGYLDGLRALTQWAVDSAQLLAGDEATAQYLAAIERIPAHALPQLPNVPTDDLLPGDDGLLDGEAPIAGPEPTPAPEPYPTTPLPSSPKIPPISLGQIGGLDLDIKLDLGNLSPNWQFPSPGFTLNLGGLGLNGAGLNLGHLELPPAFQNLVDAAPQLKNQYEVLQAALDAGDWGKAAGLAQNFLNTASHALTGEDAINIDPSTLKLLDDATRFSQALDRGDVIGLLTSGGRLVDAFGFDGLELDLDSNATLQGLGAVAALHTALQNGDSAAIFKYGLATLDYIDGLDGSADWGALGGMQSNLGTASSLTGLLNALDSGDSAAALSSGLQLAQQVSSMAGNTALANTLGQAVPWVAMAVSLSQGNAIGAVASAMMYSGNPYVMAAGFVLSLASSFLGGDAPPPTAHSRWEYDEATGEFVEHDAESADGGSLDTLRQLAQGYQAGLDQLIQLTGGQLARTDLIQSIDFVQSDTRLYIGGERYDFSHAGQGLEKAILDAFRNQIQIEGGDPLLKRALYNSEATTMAELAADLEAAQAWRNYQEGRLVLDENGRPLDAEGLQRFEADRQALEAGELSPEDFNARYRLTTVQAHVDGIIDAIPADALSDYQSLLTEQQANAAELARLPGELDALRKQLLQQSISAALDNDSEAAEQARQKLTAHIAELEARQTELTARQEAIAEQLDHLHDAHPNIDEALHWQSTLDQAATLALDQPHWSDNVTRLGALIEQIDPDFLHRTDLADLEVELQDGKLILRTAEKDYQGAEQKELAIENWESWDKDNSHIRLENGSRVNLQALITAYGITDGGGPVDMGEAAALRFVNVEGIDAPRVGQAIGGTGADDVLRAGYETVWLDGGVGNDTLVGSVGDDVLRGGAGADALDGGAGSDTALYDDSDAGVFVSLEDGIGRGGHAEGDTLRNVENLVGSAHDDVLIGDAGGNRLYGGGGDDLLRGGGGADVLDGGAGSDTVDYGDSAAGVRVSLRGGDAEGDVLINIENLSGSAHDDVLIGDDGVNRLDGGAGNDILDGGAGDDVLFGGAGRDVLLGGTGNDYLDGGADDDVLLGGDGDDMLLGGGGRNLLDGGDGTDVALFDGEFESYRFSVRNGALVVEGDDSQDVLLNVEYASFNGHVYEVSSLIEYFDTGYTVDDGGEVVQGQRRERDVIAAGNRAAEIALAAVFGTAAALYADKAAAGGAVNSTRPNDAGLNDGNVAADGTALGAAGISIAPSAEGAAPWLSQWHLLFGNVGVQDADMAGATLPPVNEHVSLVLPEGKVFSPLVQESMADGPISGENSYHEGDRATHAYCPEQPLIPPGVSLEPIETDEDLPVPVVLKLLNANPDSQMMIRITGLPPGAKLSAGIEVKPGEWALTEADVPGLIFLPPAHSDLDFVLRVTVVVYDGKGRVAASISEEQIVIHAVADMPELAALDAAGDEDTAIPLRIGARFADMDGSEIHRLELEGIPAGTVLSAGWRDDAGLWHLAPEQLDGLTLTPPEHSDVDFTVTVRAFATERANGSEAVATTQFEVAINAVADAPLLDVLDIVTDEDTIPPVDIGAALVDMDGSELLSVLIEGVPEGARLSHGSEFAPGVWRLEPQDMEELILFPREHSDEDFQLRITATATEQENGHQAHTVRLLNVTLNARADGAIIDTQAATGQQNQFIDLVIDTTLIDGDGSESLAVEISNVPPGATLSAGTDRGDGVWRLTTEQLAGLKILPPLDAIGSFRLTVTSFATEVANGDIAVNHNVLDVNVIPQPSTPGLSVAPLAGVEDEPLAMNITVDTSVLKAHERLVIEIAGLPDGASLSAGTRGADGVWRLTPQQLAGLMLTPPLNDDHDFTLQVSAITEVPGYPGISQRVSATAPARIEARADGVDLVAAPSAGLEDGFVELKVKAVLRDADSSEAVTVEISGVPAGARLSAGTELAPGVWSLTAAQLNGLMLKPPADWSGELQLGVRAITRELANGHTLEQTATLAVTVAAVADVPGLALVDVAAQPGATVPLNIAAWLNDTDGSETLSIELRGLPGGATLSAGTKSGGVWTLTRADLGGLTMTLPGGAGADFHIDVTARAMESSGDVAEVASTLAVHYQGTGAPFLSVRPLAVSSPTMDDDTLIGVNTVDRLYGGGGKDVLRGLGGDDELWGDRSDASATVQLQIQAELSTTDGSQMLRVVIADLPDGAALSAGDRQPDGSWLLTATDLSGLVLTVPASAGDFTMTVSAVALPTGGGATRVTTLLADVYLPDRPGDDYLDGGAGNDSLYGGVGNDQLYGGSGNDYLEGGAGDDLLVGGYGRDRLHGGAGGDILIIDADDDPYDINGGDGFDTAFIDDDRGMWFHAGLAEVEKVVGGKGADTLIASAGGTLLIGGGGADTLIGGVGDDEIHVDREDLQSGYVTGGEGLDTALVADERGVVFDLDGRSFEWVSGGAGGDTFLYAEAAAIDIFAGAGSDRVQSGAGADRLDGGEDNDTLDYSRSTAGVEVDLAAGAGRGGFAEGDVLSRFENVMGSNHDDVLRGDGGDNVLTGGGGDDALYGDTGFDTAVFSGRFTDYYNGHDLLGITRNANGSYTVDGTDGRDTLYGIAALRFDDRTIHLDGRNNRPEAVADMLHVDEDQSITISVAELLANDFDFDGDGIGLVDVGNASNGTVRWNGDGTITFTPNANYNSCTNNEYDIHAALYYGAAGFDYTLRDSNGAEHSASVTVDVAPVNDAPTMTRGRPFSVTGSISGKGTVVATDIDSNPEELKFTATDLTISKTVDVPSGLFGWRIYNYNPVDGTYYLPGYSEKFVATSYRDVTDDLGRPTGEIMPSEGRFTKMGQFLPTAPVVSGNTVELEFSYKGYQSPIAYHYWISEEMRPFTIVVSDGGEPVTGLNVGTTSISAGVYRSGTWWEPIVLDMDGDGIELVSVQAGISFGAMDMVTGWVGPDDGLLAYDWNGDGRVDDMSELAFFEEGMNDLETLRYRFDTNGDGVFDSNDDKWHSFGVWRDGNQDGISNEGEFLSLSERGITAIPLDYISTDTVLDGNKVVGLGRYLDGEGMERELGVVYFDVQDVPGDDMSSVQAFNLTTLLASDAYSASVDIQPHIIESEHELSTLVYDEYHN
ncbi:MAG: cadherin-like domain-containing protein [Pseudomonadota bacterium]